MPTRLLRHSITETPDIAAAVDVARATLPTASRADALRYLIHLGAESVQRDEAVRQAALERWSGCLTGTYPADVATRMKDEWPN